MGCCQASAAPEEERLPLRQKEIDRIRSRMNDKVGECSPSRDDVRGGAGPQPPGIVGHPPHAGSGSSLQSSAASVSNPTTPERYKKEKKLGKGAFGIVWKALDTKTNKHVAIKVISKEKLAMDEGNKARLAREVAIMKSLRHKNLVNLYGFITNDAEKEVWMIVECIDGSDLMAVIDRDGRIAEARARAYFQQMIAGMHYVHSQNVVHRDLKPDNIMIDHTDTVKITDFGLSNFQDTDENGVIQKGFSLKTCCGTPYYVAPEVITLTNDKGYSGFTCDVWSLGIILFVMLVGKTPFQGETLQKLLDNITKGIYFFPPTLTLPSSAKQCVRTMLVAADKRVTLPELAEDPWVSVGFDKSALNSAVAPPPIEDPALLTTIKTIGKW